MMAAVGAMIDRLAGGHMADAKDLKVGDTLYLSDGTPIYIVGDTRITWILNTRSDAPAHSQWGRHTVKKKELKERSTGWLWIFLSLEEASEYRWMRTQQHFIGSAVGGVKDPAILRQIAALIGFKDVDTSKR